MKDSTTGRVQPYIFSIVIVLLKTTNQGDSKVQGHFVSGRLKCPVVTLGRRISWSGQFDNELKEGYG
jgi:hypothetical protein